MSTPKTYGIRLGGGWMIDSSGGLFWTTSRAAALAFCRQLGYDDSQVDSFDDPMDESLLREPVPPEDLSPSARAEWDRMMASLRVGRLAKLTPGDLLADYCRSFGRLADLGLASRDSTSS